MKQAFCIAAAIFAMSLPAWAQTWGACSNGAGGNTGCIQGENVGIGTAAPANILVIEQDHNGGTYLDVTNATSGAAATTNVRVINDAGTPAYLGIYSTTSTPVGALAAGEPYVYTTATGLTLMDNNASGAIKFASGGVGESMRISSSGYVGIGTTNPQYPLAVHGTIQAEEVLVNTGWSDYVFAPDYRLRPLREVATYIAENHHLPDIPSEAQVKENGVSLGEMQSKLLAKIEELTLHMIQSEERNDRLEGQNRDLQDRIARLESYDAKAEAPSGHAGR